MKLSDEQRARWADGLRQRPSAEGCPGDDTIWSAIAGELSDVDTHRVVDHLSRCGPCSTSWQLAREMHGEISQEATLPDSSTLEQAESAPPQSNAPMRSARGVKPWIPRAMALAAALLLAFAAYPVVRDRIFQPTLDPIFRSLDSAALTAVDSEEIPLSRDACVLRWQGSPRGSLYSVTVSDSTGAMSWTVRGIEDSELLVPADKLEGLEAGAQLLWQVEATLPDGQKQESFTFVHTLE